MPMQAEAQVRMFKPERVGHWYVSGADANLGVLVPGDLDMGGDFLFATVRGHF